MFELMMSGGKVPAPPGKVAKIGTVDGGIVALTDTGNMYTISNLYTSGTGAKVTEWTLLGTGVSDFRCGYRAILWRTTDGKWMFVGANNYFGSLAANLYSPTDVTAQMDILSALEIKQWDLSHTTMAVLYTSGMLRLRGLNNSGGCALGSTATGKNSWNSVNGPAKIVQFALDYATLDTTYVLLEDGRVGGWGSGSQGQLGGAVANNTALTFIANAANTLNADIIGGSQALFVRRRHATMPNYHQIWSNGFQSSGSIGRGSGANSANPQSALVAAPSVAIEDSPFVMGVYMAKFWGTNGRWNHTGNNPPANGALSWNSGAYLGVFTEMPLETQNPTKNWVFSRGSVNQSYFIEEGRLYGAGNTADGLLPGHLAGTLRTFEELDTTPLI
ncbi:hypothetical protein POP15_208 [Pectobacterium phage POP15]|nr:hypothetical protein POP15_208 [Pectobacterium phage POP15]